MSLQHTTPIRIAALLTVVLGLAVVLGGRFADQSEPPPPAGSATGMRDEPVGNAGDALSDPVLRRLTPNANGPPTAADSETDSGVPVIDLNSVTGFQEILDQLGIDRDAAEWARSRGFIWVPEVGFEYDSPYKGLSVAELEALVEMGDEEAKLALAMAIVGSDPAVAVDLYYELAVDGNPEAMIGMGNAYGHMEYALESPDESGLAAQSMTTIEGLTALGTDPEIESLAWLYVANSYTGFPRTFPGDLPDDMWPVLVRACDRAVELWQQISSQLAADGRSIPDLTPVPFSPGSLDMDNMLMAACPPERLPTADFSRCRPIKIYDQGYTYDGFACP